MKIALIAATGLLFSGATAFAQSADQSAAPAPQAAAPADTAAAPADSTAAPVTDPAAPGAAASFTDEQINDFASAMVKIQEVAADATIDDTQKQTQMVAIVQAEGLDPETFNAIGSASQSDPELQQRVQIAFANAQGGTQNQ
mgnify:CR=1 FL=1